MNGLPSIYKMSLDLWDNSRWVKSAMVFNIQNDEIKKIDKDMKNHYKIKQYIILLKPYSYQTFWAEHGISLEDGFLLLLIENVLKANDSWIKKLQWTIENYSKLTS